MKPTERYLPPWIETLREVTSESPVPAPASCWILAVESPCPTSLEKESWNVTSVTLMDTVNLIEFVHELCAAKNTAAEPQTAAGHCHRGLTSALEDLGPKLMSCCARARWAETRRRSPLHSGHKPVAMHKNTKIVHRTTHDCFCSAREGGVASGVIRTICKCCFLASSTSVTKTWELCSTRKTCA